VINSIGTAVLTTLAFVLACAGVAKLLSRGRAAGGRAFTTDRTGTAGRLLPVGELLVAAWAIIAPAAESGPVLAAVYAGFAVTHANRWRAGREECDCFGAETTRTASGPRPLLVTAVSAVLALAAGLTGGAGLAVLATRHPAAAVATFLVAIAGAYGWRLAFGARPRRAGVADERLGRSRSAGDRLVSASALFLERRLSRRTVLLQIAVTGSALTVAPLRYLLYPGSALAAIAPGNCPGGLCDDGYTGFCCEINDGLNTCPENTFPGGWWMCTDYAGRQLCSEQGVRYYVDCNALPHVEADGGCHCGGGSCGNRRIGCNVFRYGQCNTHIPGITPVVCRMVVCENPSSIPALNCSGSVAVDNAVCDHEAPCLEPRPRQLAGAGGV
jgi:methylamine utilization protein MauE